MLLCPMAQSCYSKIHICMVEWFAKMVEERKKNHDTSKEKKTGKERTNENNSIEW